MTYLQTSFSFPKSQQFHAEDFVLTTANQYAYKQLMSWPKGDEVGFEKCFLLSGPEGSGKTHLCHVWQGRHIAHFMEPNFLSVRADNNECYIIEDIDMVDDEEALLHAINACLESQICLLLTSAFPPIQMRVKLPDLYSRLQAMPLAMIESPDDELLHVLLQKHCSDRQLRISDDVLRYIASRMERSYYAVNSIAEKLEALSLLSQRPITIPLIKKECFL